MVIDSSAIIAILRGEPDADALERRLVAAPVRLIPATCVLEARMVLASRFGDAVLTDLDLWLAQIDADIISIDAELADLATVAWLTYGKGRHQASLNFADCFSFAVAKRAGLPLLFKGEDFAKTDLTNAMGLVR
jgi:ribonuclease VapC